MVEEVWVVMVLMCGMYTNDVSEDSVVYSNEIN